MSKYLWTPGGSVSVDDFVKKFKPSIVDKDDTDWLQVWTKSQGQGIEAEVAAHEKALGKATVVVDDLVKEIKDIEANDDIPVRAKKGVKSKKVVREEAHAAAAQKLKDISLESGWTTGKWLFFPRSDDVDRIWSMIARSVAYGPLKAAGVTSAKVASADASAGDQGMHMLAVYVDDMYDKEQATKILVSLLKEHGLEPSACKTDLYTVVGIDSNHPSKLRSTIWRPSELIEGGAEKIKDMKSQYKRGDEKSWKPSDEDSDTKKDEATEKPEGKRSVSFSEKVAEEPKRKAEEPKKPKAAVKRQKSAAASYKENDMFAGSDADEDE